MSDVALPRRTLVERFYAEIWNRGDEAVARAILAPDFRFRGSLGVTADDVDGFLAYVRSVRAALGDYRCIIDDMIVDGDSRAAARMTFTGVHRGELLGVAATGRTVSWSGAAFFTAATAASPSYGCSAISTASGGSCSPSLDGQRRLRGRSYDPRLRNTT